MNMPAMKKSLEAPYADVLGRVVEALGAEGFGVLSEIDVEATLRKKLGIDFRPYVILGACNPALANRALSSSLDVGVLLPCNVAVYRGEGDTVVVSAVDPVAAIGAFGDETLEQLAREVRDKLARVLEAL